MKKVLAITLSIMLIFAMVGCSSSNDNGDGNGAAERTEFVFHTGAAGGGYMAFAAMFVDRWEKEIDGFLCSAVSGGSFTNAINVENSQTGNDLGASFNTVLADGVNYVGDFPDKLEGPIENVQALVRLNRVTSFLAPTLADTVPEGVTTVGEYLALKPKITLYNKERGTGGEIVTRRVLEAYGVTYDDIVEWGGRVIFTSTSDGIAQVTNRHGNAAWQGYMPRAADLQELESSRDITWLELDQHAVEYLEKNFGYMPYTVPATDFRANKPVYTVAEDTIVYTHKDAPEEYIYKMTKIILENQEAWARGQVAFETFEPENAWQDTVVPLHPGAERAFKELGFMD